MRRLFALFPLVRRSRLRTLIEAIDELRLKSHSAAVEIARSREELVRADERHDRLLGAISATGEGLVITEDDRVVHANGAFCDLVGFNVCELQALPSLFDLVPAAERAVLRGRMLARQGGQGGPAQYTSQLQARDGHIIDVETVVQALPGEGGRQAVAIVRDITRRRRADMLRSVQFGVTSLLNVSPSLRDAAPHMLEMIGEALGCKAVGLWLPSESGGDFCQEYQWQPWTDALVQSVHGGDPPAEFRDLVDRVIRENACSMVGDSDEIKGLGFPVHADGGVNGVVVLSAPRSRLAHEEIFDVLVDIGGRIGQHIVHRRAEEQLRDSVIKLAQMASTDALTGLQNRRAFDQRLAEVGTDCYAVLSIDVDNLKEINTEYTQEGGDLVLRAVAVTLASLLRPGDLLARVGGDEFAAILPAVGAAEAAAVAERMRMAISAASMPVGRASISVGFVAAPAGADPHAVRAAAAEVLLQAKSRGKDRVEGGEPGAPLVRAAMARDAELVGRIFDTDVMGVVYQPVVQLSDRITMGFEAFARPQGFPPLSSVDGLFTAAKRLGRLKEVDWLCRRVALAQAPRMTGGHALFINVNAATLLHPVHPVDQTLLVLRSAGISARRLVFELSVLEDVRDLERLRSVLADYRAHHIRFAIDDVGARPSLELVTALQPDFIKVSSSLLTSRLSTGRRSALNTVIDTARRAGATLIAKGVETPQAAERAAELGFAWGQGFWLGPPASRRPARSRVRRGPLQQELPLPVHVTGHRVDRARR